MAIKAATLVIDVNADTRKGERDIRGFVEKSAGTLQKGFSGMAAAMGVGITAAVVGQVGRAVTELAKLSDASARVGNAYKDMAASAGASSTQMLDALRQASGGAINDYNLMLSANRAMMLGVADSTEEMTALMQVARERGTAMGLSMEQAFGDLVTGLGRASPLILDNLGIVVDSESLYREYAASLGKSADALTEVEKKQALVNKVMQEAGSTSGEAMVSSFERASAAIDNMKVALGDLFSPAVAAVAETIANAVTEAATMMDPSKVGGELASLSEDIAVQTEILLDKMERLNDPKLLWSGPLKREVDDAREALSLLVYDYNLAASEMQQPLINLEKLITGDPAYLVAFKDYDPVGAAAAEAAERQAESARVLGAAYAGVADVQARYAAQQEVVAMATEAAGGNMDIAAGLTQKYNSILATLMGNGYTAEAAMAKLGETVANDAAYFDNLATEAEALGIALAEGIKWGADQASFAIDAFVANAAAGLGAVFSWLGRVSHGITQGASTGTATPAGPPMSASRTPSGVPSWSWEKPFVESTQVASQGMKEAGSGASKLGSAASDAAEGISDLEGMLGKVPGLFGITDVTQEDMDAAASGTYKEKADEYLRQLKAEVFNGADYEGVDIKDAAAALGLDGSVAAEEVYAQFEAAWQNHSLFANPANLNFLNMDAIQASLDQQLQSAEGEKNLKALFGIGDAEDVSAVASLGLDVQSGLASWLSENGMTDAAASLGAALGAGIKDAPDELGAGVGGGLTSWAGSESGQAELKSVGETIAANISKYVIITPTVTPPTDGRTPPPGGQTPPSGFGGTPPPPSGRTPPPGGTSATLARTGGATVTVNATVTQPHDVEMLARRVASYLGRRT